MPNKSTKEEFVEKAQSLYKDAFDYSLVEYRRSNEKVSIICRKCLKILNISPNSHLRGTKCRDCSHKELGLKRLMPEEDFINKLKDLYEDKYEYHLVHYRGNKYSVDLVCKLHGRFTKSAGKLLSGSSCQKCGFKKLSEFRTSNTSEFIRKAEVAHDNKYDYASSEYVNNTTKLLVGCGVHGSFKISPDCHLSGQGCPQCVSHGFNRFKPANFYILQDQKGVVKIGITNNVVKLRVNQINRSKDIKFKVHIYFYSEDGQKIYDIEKQALKYLRSKYQPVTEVFDGSTECFLDVDLNDLISFVTPLANEQTI